MIHLLFADTRNSGFDLCRGAVRRWHVYSGSRVRCGGGKRLASGTRTKMANPTKV